MYLFFFYFSFLNNKNVRQIVLQIDQIPHPDELLLKDYFIYYYTRIIIKVCLV